MTRILQAGFETGDTARIGTDSTNVGTVAVVSASPSPRSGTYSFKCTHGGSGSNGFGRKRITHTSQTELYWAFGFYPSTSLETLPAPNLSIFRTYDTAGNVNFVVFFDGGSLRVYVATGGTGSPSSAQLTLVGGPIAVSQTAWHLLEIHAIAATGATGTLEMKLDGVSVVSVTSQRTCQVNANFVEFALEDARLGVPGSGTTFIAFDDVRVNSTAGTVNNSWPGDEAIVMLVPNAAGDSSQFSRGGADAGTNYLQVDDVPPNGTTDYVYDATSGHLDLYNLSTVALATVSAVSVIAQVFNSDGAGGQLYLPTKTAAGQSDGSAMPLTGTPAYQSRLLETDPADSGAWTQTKINALQVGVKVV